MDTDTAKDISDKWLDGNKLDAIRVLRNETSMGLIQAKTYLETHNSSISYTLLEQIHEDFVDSKPELLKMAIDQRNRLNDYILHLQEEIRLENVDVFTAQNAQEITRAMMPDIYTDEDLNIG